MSRYGFGLIGCGKIAPKHAEALKELGGARLVAVCDTDSARVETFAAQYGTRGYTRVEDLLADPEVDVVSICTPSGLHAPLAIAAANAGKHVLVEKPLALTPGDCQDVIRAGRAAGVKLAVVHPNRFLPNVIALREAILDRRFGQLGHGVATVRWFRPAEYYSSAAWRGTRTMDGGVLFNQAIHDIDLLQWLLGPVETVTGMVATRLREIESEDVGAVVMRFRSGALGIIEASATVYPENLEESLAVFGETGSAVIGGRTIGQGVRVWRFADSTVAPPDVGAKPPHWGHQQVIADLVTALETGREPMVNGEEAAKAVAIIHATYESARSGRETTPAF